MGIERVGSGLHHSCWTEDKNPQYRATLCQTGSEIVRIFAARYARQGAVREICRRAFSFTSRDAVVYNDDDSDTIEVRRLLDDRLRAGMSGEVVITNSF